MTGDKKRRVEKLEKAGRDKEVKIVVNWDIEPEPPGEGVTVVTWDDEENEQDD